MLQETKVNRVEVLKIVKTNRDNHRAHYERAVVGYKVKARLALEEMLAKVHQSKDLVMVAVNLNVPIDQTKEYDRAIRMLEMSVDDVITLDHGTFINLVMDEWAWSGGTTALNQSYAAFAK